MLFSSQTPEFSWDFQRQEGSSHNPLKVGPLVKGMLMNETKQLLEPRSDLRNIAVSIQSHILPPHICSFLQVT